MENKLLLSRKNQAGKGSQINYFIFIPFFSVFMQERLMTLELKYHSRKTYKNHVDDIMNLKIRNN
jgi:hypothetical protein